MNVVLLLTLSWHRPSLSESLSLEQTHSSLFPHRTPGWINLDNEPKLLQCESHVVGWSVEAELEPDGGLSQLIS